MSMKIKPALALLICGVAASSCATVSSHTENGAAQAPPKILKPMVKKIWIAPEIRNGGAEWVEGHYLYRIEKETTWSR